jgi:hypothetical protein
MGFPVESSIRVRILTSTFWCSVRKTNASDAQEEETHGSE